MRLVTQIITTALEVTCSDDRLLREFQRFCNHADHRLPAETHISFSIGFDGTEYHLPSGQREISPVVAAEAAWDALQVPLSQALMPWLQVSGVCVEWAGARILVLGESRAVFGLLAIHALASGLDVPSEAGVCVKDGLAIPYALPIDVSDQDLLRFQFSRGLSTGARTHRAEDGAVRHLLHPGDFGRNWIIDRARIDEILVLKWNPGGWSGFGRTANPWLLEHILKSAHLPAAAPPQTKLRMIAQARELATSTPSVDFHLGRIEDAPRLFADRLSAQSAA